MSRSLLGSSSTSRSARPSAAGISWSRRRSPPDRSRTCVQARPPPNPNRSHSCAAVSSRPSASAMRRRTDSSDSSTRTSPSRSSSSCERNAGRTVEPRLTVPPSGSTSPSSTPQQRRLAAAVDADQRDAVARPEAPRQPAEEAPLAQCARRRPRGRRPAAEARGRELEQLDRGRAAPARRRSARWRASMRNRGFDVAAPGPRCSHASSFRSRFLRRSSVAAAMRSRSGPRQHPGRVAAVVLVHVVPGSPPRCGCRRHRGTTGHGSRRRAPAGCPGVAAPASRRPRRRGGWSARRAAAGQSRPAAASRGRSAVARRRSGAVDARPSGTVPRRRRRAARRARRGCARRRPTRGRRGRRSPPAGSCAPSRGRRPGRACRPAGRRCA